MRGQRCWFITLTQGYGDLLLHRAGAWHRLLTRLRKRWPDCQAWTVLEYGTRRGVHLHIAVKGTPGITAEWLEYLVGLVGDGTHVHSKEVHNQVRLARYLAKQLANQPLMSGWPKYLHLVSTTRRWCPEWRRRTQWRARTLWGRP